MPYYIVDLLKLAREDMTALESRVVLACADYNALFNCLDDVENRVFADTLKRLDRKIMSAVSGGKTTWLSRGVKDNFLVDMRKSISEVWTVVQSYKTDRSHVLRGIWSEINKLQNVMLVHIERNYIHDEGVFEERQIKHRAACRETLHQTQRSIMTMLTRMYAIIKHDGVGVQRAWARWVKSIDVRLLAALRKAVVRSLRELHAAIVGDSRGDDSGLAAAASGIASVNASSASAVGGDGGGGGGDQGILPTDVQPIFRLNMQLGASDVEYRTTLDDLARTLNHIGRELITCIKSFQRVEVLLPQEFKGYLATDASIKDMQAKKEAATMGLGKQEDDKDAKITHDFEGKEMKEGKEDGQDEAAPAEHFATFYELIASAAPVQAAIQAIEDGVTEARNKLEEHRKNDFLRYDHLWNADKATYMRRYGKMKVPLEQYEIDMGKFLAEEQDVRDNIDNTQSFGPVQVDHTMLKEALIDHCVGWQKSFAAFINDSARTELDKLLSRMNEAITSLTSLPTELVALTRNVKMMKELEKERLTMELRFGPLEQTYALLAKYEISVDPEELARLSSVRSIFKTFSTALETGEDLIKRAKLAMKKDTVDNVTSFSNAISELKPTSLEGEIALPFAMEPIASAKEKIADWRARLAALRARGKVLISAIEVFELPMPDLTPLTDVETDITNLESVWMQVELWENDYNAWKTGAFAKLDVTVMEESSARARQRLIKMREFKKWLVWGSLDTQIKDFQATMPLISSLSNPAMRERHWKSLKAEIGVDFDPESVDFTLERVIDFGFVNFADFIGDLSNRANKELAIETALREIKAAWDALDLDIVEYKSVYYKLRSTEDLFQTLEDHAVNVSSMKASPFSSAFPGELDAWEKRLSTVSEVVDMLLQVQRQWMYLESIFMASEDIRKMLPVEASLFDDVNASYSTIMIRCNEDRNALSACMVDGFLADLEAMDAKLEKIQKALDAYLENKRQQFPRFYFLSNDDLLEILGQSKDPVQVQKHIKKAFEGIQTLQLVEPGAAGNKTYEAVGMNAPDGEKVPFERKVIVDGPVECWLIEVEKCMRLALAKQSMLCLPAAKGKDKLKWIKDFPGQLTITTGMMYFVISA